METRNKTIILLKSYLSKAWRQTFRSNLTESKYSGNRGECNDLQIHQIDTSYRSELCDGAETDLMLYNSITEYIIPIIFSLVGIIGIIGNLLVIAVIFKNIKMQTSPNILIFSLALSDLCLISICIPSTIMNYLGGWNLSLFFCQFSNYMIFVICYCSVYTLILMSLDRYLAVVFPARSKSLRTTKNTEILVLLVWIISLLLNIVFPDYRLKIHQLFEKSGFSNGLSKDDEERKTCVNDEFHLLTIKAKLWYIYLILHFCIRYSTHNHQHPIWNNDSKSIGAKKENNRAR